MAKKCVVQGCEEEAKYKRSGLCANCYQGMYWWAKKGPTRVLERRAKLDVYAARLDALIPKKRR